MCHPHQGGTLETWGGALIGLDVEIYDHARMIDSGEVEDATMDGRVLWLAMDGAQPRRLIELNSEWQIKIRPSATGTPDD